MATLVRNEANKRAIVHQPRRERIPTALRRKADALLVEDYDYMDSPLFRRKAIEKDLFNFDVEPQLPMTAWYQPTREDLLEGKIVGQPQLMKGDEERLMFLRFNYSKKRLSALKKRIKKDGLRTREDAEQVIEWHRRFEHFREYLVRTNLALVLAMAKRTRLGDVDFAEIVSEGNMALIRAVDKFDVGRGFKFSTYACRAILKAFSRTSLKHSRQRTRFPVVFDPDLEMSDWIDRKRDVVEEDCIDELKQIVDRNLADLSDTEQTVIRRRFNWEQKQDSGLTLEEVGAIIGVTKERVRQIQNKALAKIRSVMEDGVLKTKSEQKPEPVQEEAHVVASPEAP
jgi:RNA polymerase sigma factor (sigma-70 family)